MKHFLYGMDTQNPASCARHLREHGFDAVVLGDATPETAAALEAEGLELYLCFGAYGISKESDALAVDAHGKPRRWFSSGCPNDMENAEKHLNAVLEKAAALPSVRGILVDGARFASFASVEGIASFFTCFCPRCMQAMNETGLDADAIKAAVGRQMETRCPQPQDEELLRQWFAFREKTVQRYMDRFAARVHELRSDLIAGAFIFAPSLGAFVGQTANACRSLDVVSHMLYRAYPHEAGVACLGHEWAAFLAGFGASAEALRQIAMPHTALFMPQNPEKLLTNGFAPEWVGTEVALAHRIRCGGQQLWPILQIEDERIHETISHAKKNGADAVGLFMWGQADVPSL